MCIDALNIVVTHQQFLSQYMDQSVDGTLATKWYEQRIYIFSPHNFSAHPPVFTFIFACFYIWLHVSWESRLGCYVGHKHYERYMFQLNLMQLVKGDEIVRAWDRHSNETGTLMKHVTKHKNMRKWMIKFLRKYKSRGDKIALVNSIRITKSTNLL